MKKKIFWKKTANLQISKILAISVIFPDPLTSPSQPSPCPYQIQHYPPLSPSTTSNPQTSHSRNPPTKRFYFLNAFYIYNSSSLQNASNPCPGKHDYFYPYTLQPFACKFGLRGRRGWLECWRFVCLKKGRFGLVGRICKRILRCWSLRVLVVKGGRLTHGCHFRSKTHGNELNLLQFCFFLYIFAENKRKCLVRELKKCQHICTGLVWTGIWNNLIICSFFWRLKKREG